MKKGDKVKFPFGRQDKKGNAVKELEGEVVGVNEKTVLIRADFPHHPGKIIKRKIHDVKAG
jgi:hypothetical protein